MSFKVGEESANWAQHLAKLDFWYEAATSSTNSIAKESAFDSAITKSPIALYFTDHQNQGRGRGQNKWINPKEGNSLLSSWSFLMGQPPSPLITCSLGLAVFRALTATWPHLAFSLKAPNDIYLADKKLGGLLVETVSEGDRHRLVLGLGLNVFSFPSVLDNATSLSAALSINNELSKEIWFGFLDRLLLELSISMHHRAQFLTADKSPWLYALNLRPNKATNYLDLDAQGNLLTSQGLVPWTSL